jgi:hypothetical protein
MQTVYYKYTHLSLMHTHTHTHAHTRTHTHTLSVCPPLSLVNADVSYSPENRDIGSVATYACKPGYQPSSLQAGMTRTCSINGWSDQNFTCERE